LTDPFNLEVTLINQTFLLPYIGHYTVIGEVCQGQIGVFWPKICEFHSWRIGAKTGKK